MRGNFLHTSLVCSILLFNLFVTPYLRAGAFDDAGLYTHQMEIALLRAKIKAAGLSAEASEKVERELRLLEQMPSYSYDAPITRNYIDWVISLPWNKLSTDTVSLEKAEKIINQNHAGLKKPKERILEYLAAKKFSPAYERAPILCLIGPPGVGKTSLAHSIADSLGREFVRISLGGVRDEAEIRGHRKTYVGALPGKIIQALRKAKTANPVILLDEIDKLAKDHAGDPAAALLEVLDPEQNHSFVDHFIEVGFNLSRVIFIATANSLNGIPYALLDRMECIFLGGYTEYEKAEIARSFLIPKNLKEHNLTKEQFKVPDPQLTRIIREYTKESGVRQLERTLTKLMRKTIQMFLKNSQQKQVTISETLTHEWLGSPHYRKKNFDSIERIGLATGLAWTEVGGDILEIEVTVLPGKGALTLTGQLGNVMQESAQAALSYIRSRADSLGLENDFYASKDLHIHLPEGGIPKDGPSAGIALCAALVSALTKNPTRADVAMTGEITLRGRVLPVGGLKEKLLAARAAGIKEVLVSEENRDDVEEIMQEIGKSDSFQVIYVKTMDEVLHRALKTKK